MKSGKRLGSDREILGWTYPIIMPIIWAANIVGWLEDRKNGKPEDDDDDRPAAPAWLM